MDKNKIKVWFDEKTDILYISFKKGPAVDSEEINDNVRVEYGKKGEVIGIEIHNITQIVAKSLATHLKKEVKI